MEKIIAVVGPTSSGKTYLSIKLAKEFGGEIISADSRQIYKGFNLCSGKVTKREMAGIPHFLLDIASPLKTYTVARFTKNAQRAVRQIIKGRHTPMVVGGTGLYVDTLLRNQSIPEVPPNPKLRRQLEHKTVAELFADLQSKDPQRAKTIDPHNPRRLIRALEIVQALGKIPPQKQTNQYDVLYLGLNPVPKILRRKIHLRLLKRIKLGMVREIKNLHDIKGLSWKRLESFGLELKYIPLYLQKKLTREQMIQGLETAIWRYAKRQLTWFKRNKNIHWLATETQAKQLIKTFIETR